MNVYLIFFQTIDYQILAQFARHKLTVCNWLSADE
jgi:hypothetical protein